LPATVDDGKWVITSYLAANAIILPITGWLSAHLGRRNYFLLSRRLLPSPPDCAEWPPVPRAAGLAAAVFSQAARGCCCPKKLTGVALRGRIPIPRRVPMSSNSKRNRGYQPYLAGKRTPSQPGDELQGGWTEAQLMRMDADFVVAMERAIAAGLERPQEA